MILMRANPLLRPLEGVGPEISTFLGPHGTRYSPEISTFLGPHDTRYTTYLPYQGPRKFWFQGPPIPMALVMNIG